jgi:hypothetical protein
MIVGHKLLLNNVISVTYGIMLAVFMLYNPWVAMIYVSITFCLNFITAYRLLISKVYLLNYILEFDVESFVGLWVIVEQMIYLTAVLIIIYNLPMHYAVISILALYLNIFLLLLGVILK